METLSTEYAPVASKKNLVLKFMHCGTTVETDRKLLRRVMQNVVMLRDGLDAVPEDSWRVEVNWTPCRYVSPSVAADWAVKAVGADPELQGTTVVRRRLGLSQGEVDGVDSEIRRKGSTGLLERVLQARAVEPVEGASDGDAA